MERRSCRRESAASLIPSIFPRISGFALQSPLTGFPTGESACSRSVLFLRQVGARFLLHLPCSSSAKWGRDFSYTFRAQSPPHGQVRPLKGQTLSPPRPSAMRFGPTAALQQNPRKERTCGLVPGRIILLHAGAPTSRGAHPTVAPAQKSSPGKPAPSARRALYFPRRASKLFRGKIAPTQCSPLVNDFPTHRSAAFRGPEAWRSALRPAPMDERR
jgi:hypothetical protein